MPINIATSDIESLLCCDSVLNGIQWATDGRDLELVFELGDNSRGVLLCSWVDNVRLNIESGPKDSGVPMVEQVFIENPVSGDRYRFSVHFSGNQQLSLECETLALCVGRNE